MIKYQVTITTGDLWNAGTDASVFVTLYGDRGDTGVRLLNRSKDKKFIKGEVSYTALTFTCLVARLVLETVIIICVLWLQTSSFTVEAVSLGELRRLVIGHDGRGPGEGWFLDKVIVKESNVKNPREWMFPCRR